MSVASIELHNLVVHQVLEILQEDDFLEDITLSDDTKLVEDLNFASMDFIELVVGIEDNLQQKVGFYDLLTKEGSYVEDLSIGELTLFIESKLKGSSIIESKLKDISTSSTENLQETSPFPPSIESKLTPFKINEFRQAIEPKITDLFRDIPALDVSPEEINQKNPSVIFLLSPPRCGSTLLRVILAGNNQLFAPPELHLLSYATLSQRKSVLSNDWNQHLLQGTIRALMQLQSCSVEEARQIMESYEDQGITTKAFYQIIQQELSNQILVDKTPTYAASLQILKQAEANFENPLYIHLLRHPYGMIRSYEEAKLERIVPFLNDSSFSRRELAELNWLVNHENIFTFLNEIPPERKYQLKFEDLVTKPTEEIQQICQFIGVDFQPEMLEAYQDKEQRMTDGIEVATQVSGDLKFYLHKGIDPEVAFHWKKYHTHDFLSDSTWHLVEQMGYN